MKLLAAALAVFVCSHGAVAAPSCSCDGASSNTRRSRSADRKGTIYLDRRVSISILLFTDCRSEDHVLSAGEGEG